MNYFNGTNKYIVILITLISTIIINEVYGKDCRYLIVYNNYKSKGIIKNKNKAIVLSFIFIFLPYLLLCIIGLLTIIR